jgi:hypothetical protein
MNIPSTITEKLTFLHFVSIILTMEIIGTCQLKFTCVFSRNSIKKGESEKNAGKQKVALLTVEEAAEVHICNIVQSEVIISPSKNIADRKADTKATMFYITQETKLWSR